MLGVKCDKSDWLSAKRILCACSKNRTWPEAFSFPEPTILLACGRNRELWEQPFRACAIDEDLVKPDGQNSVISPFFFQNGCSQSSRFLPQARRIVGSGDENGPEVEILDADLKERGLWGRECCYC